MVVDLYFFRHRVIKVDGARGVQPHYTAFFYIFCTVETEKRLVIKLFIYDYKNTESTWSLCGITGPYWTNTTQIRFAITLSLSSTSHSNTTKLLSFSPSLQMCPLGYSWRGRKLTETRAKLLRCEYRFYRCRLDENTAFTMEPGEVLVLNNARPRQRESFIG